MNPPPAPLRVPTGRMRWHWPRFYCYRAADRHLFRVMLNAYPGAVIGLAVVIGHTAYCVKWASVGRLG